MPSDTIVALATGNESVSSVLAKNPNQDIDALAERLFPKKLISGHHGQAVRRAIKGHSEYPPDDLARAERCGKFPLKPSDIFLKVDILATTHSLFILTIWKIYSDVLDTLEQDPLIGMVSPPLLGASGVVPLTIVSTFVQFPMGTL
jgi:hypothetical protein